MHADIEDSAEPKFKHKDKAGEASFFARKTKDTLKCIDPNGGIFLRTNWQIQGYLCEQADAIEKLVASQFIVFAICLIVIVECISNYRTSNNFFVADRTAHFRLIPLNLF